MGNTRHVTELLYLNVSANTFMAFEIHIHVLSDSSTHRMLRLSANRKAPLLRPGRLLHRIPEIRKGCVCHRLWHSSHTRSYSGICLGEWLYGRAWRHPLAARNTHCRPHSPHHNHKVWDHLDEKHTWRRKISRMDKDLDILIYCVTSKLKNKKRLDNSWI